MSRCKRQEWRRVDERKTPVSNYIFSKQKIILYTIKVFPKDTSFFSISHARRRLHRRATVAIRNDIKSTGVQYAVRAILRIYSAIETSLRRLKRKRFGIVVFLYRRLRSHPILNQASHTNETLVICASLRSVGIIFEFFCRQQSWFILVR